MANSYFSLQKRFVLSVQKGFSLASFVFLNNWNKENSLNLVMIDLKFA